MTPILHSIGWAILSGLLVFVLGAVETSYGERASLTARLTASCLSAFAIFLITL